jgi:hypothetical protein
MTKPLSPAAQVIWDAFNDVFERVGVFEDYGDALAAVLRAAADQVVPEDFDYWDGSCGDYAAGCETGQNERNAHVRLQLLDIANELAHKTSTGAPDAL